MSAPPTTAIELQPVADSDRKVGLKLDSFPGQIAHFTGRELCSPTNDPGSRDSEAIQLPLWSHVAVLPDHDQYRLADGYR